MEISHLISNPLPHNSFHMFQVIFYDARKERKDLFNRNILFCCSISNLWNAFYVVSENIPLLNTFHHAISHETCLGRRDKCECWNVCDGVHQHSCWVNSRRIRTKSIRGDIFRNFEDILNVMRCFHGSFKLSVYLKII